MEIQPKTKKKKNETNMIDKYEEIDLGLGLLLDFSFRKFD